MKLPLAYYGDSILRKKAAPIEEITPFIHQLVQDMKETMEAHKGCGLAAPQVHQSLALFVTAIPREEEANEKTLSSPFRVFINPKIIGYSQETWTCQEGCLSIPGLRENVERPLKVTIQATDLNQYTFVEEFIGFDAHVIMHENDHLNGVFFIDRLSPKRKKAIEGFLKEVKRKFSPLI